MPFVPGFNPDVFISYSHRDNLTGWVSEFHNHLQIRLTELFGIDAAVWRDQKMSGADVFSAEIHKQIQGTAVFVPVLSPGYAASEWCIEELSAFESAAKKVGGIQAGNKLRAIKAVKTRLADDRHREIVPAALGFEFYARERDSSDIREFRPGSAVFEDTIDRMAQEINRVLLAMKARP